jgi:toluene monooxygenase system protein D
VTDEVGPVLEAGELADAIIAAIREQYPHVTVRDRGSYLRVLVPGRCVVRREAVERALGRPVNLPAELERVMPAFQGRLALTEDTVEWAWSTP